MQVNYNSKTDLLYFRLDDEKNEVVNRRVSEDIVLDIGNDNRLVGIEILDASRHVRMEKIFPIRYETSERESQASVVRESDTKGSDT